MLNVRVSPASSPRNLSARMMARRSVTPGSSLSVTLRASRYVTPTAIPALATVALPIRLRVPSTVSEASDSPGRRRGLRSSPPSSRASSPSTISKPDASDMRRLKKRVARIAQTQRQAALPETVGRQNPVSDRIFLPGYQHDSARSLDFPKYGKCCICGDHLIKNILLREVKATRDFYPPPNSQESCFVEEPIFQTFDKSLVDTIVPATCCDGCAFLLVANGKLPNSDNIVAAPPLVPLDMEINKRQWIDSLSRVYQYRFHSGYVLEVFLSLICSALESADTAETWVPADALRRAG